jgi:hypothetical protein
MNNTEKLLRAFIEASGYEVDEVDTSVKFYKADDIDRDGDPYVDAVPTVVSSIDYKVTKKADEERFTFTRYMIKDLIEVLGNHTVARDGHNNDDVIAIINSLEAVIDENI